MVNVYHILAIAALLLHLIWLLWVMLGWVVTRNRSLLRWLHILSVVYGILIEIFLWPCPLTYAEQWLERRVGRAPFQGSFLIHYLEALVYPQISQTLLSSCAIAVCMFVLGIHLWRFRRRDMAGW